MTAVRFGIGAEIDIASPEDVRTAVQDGVSSIGDMFRRNGKRPVYVHRVSNLRIAAGTGFHTFDFGTPPNGKIWMLQRATVAILDETSGAYVFPASTQPFMLWRGSTLPDTAPVMGLVGLFRDLEIGPSIPYPVYSGDLLYATANITVAFTNTVSATVSVLVAEYDDTSALAGRM